MLILFQRSFFDWRRNFNRRRIRRIDVSVIDDHRNWFLLDQCRLPNATSNKITIIMFFNLLWRAGAFQQFLRVLPITQTEFCIDHFQQRLAFVNSECTAREHFRPTFRYNLIIVILLMRTAFGGQRNALETQVNVIFYCIACSYILRKLRQAPAYNSRKCLYSRQKYPWVCFRVSSKNI